MRWPLSLVILTLWLVPIGASAQGDGVYGRFDGDLVLSAGAGGGVTRLSEPAGTALVDLRLRYLDVAGIFVAPTLASGVGPRVAFGVELRPLFPARFLVNAWWGHEWLDLLVDSIGIELGAAAVELDDADRRGWGLAFGTGLDVPLLLPSTFAGGLFLRLGARHVLARGQDLGGPAERSADWLLYAALTLRGVVSLGLATREPPRYRPDR